MSKSEDLECSMVRRLKVYFHQRSHHRRRQQETAETFPEEFEKVIPEGVEFSPDWAAMVGESDYRKKISPKLLFCIFPLNLRYVPGRIQDSVDYIYTWGALLLFPKKPYFIDVETPYVMSLFNLKGFHVFKILIRILLLRSNCRRIVCLSEACKQSMRAEFGERVAKKCEVVYPFIEDRTNEIRRRPRNLKTQFLFVGTAFYIKGGREVLNVFSKLAEEREDFHLTMVTRLPKGYSLPEGSESWLTLVEAKLPREEVRSTYYANADVFIMPTYDDCWGMAILEALSFGLPVISSRFYAIPEMVEHGKNGFLIEPPFMGYGVDGRAIDLDLVDLKRRIIKKPLPYVESSLRLYVLEMLHVHRRGELGRYSRKLFEEKFHPRVREQKLKKLF